MLRIAAHVFLTAYDFPRAFLERLYNATVYFVSIPGPGTTIGEDVLYHLIGGKGRQPAGPHWLSVQKLNNFALERGCSITTYGACV